MSGQRSSELQNSTRLQDNTRLQRNTKLEGNTELKSNSKLQGNSKIQDKTKLQDINTIQDVNTLIVDKLQREYGCSNDMAELTCRDLMAMKNKHCKEALFLWLQGSELREVSLEGFSTISLMKEQHFEYVGSIIALDWIDREPQVAIEALKFMK